MNDTTNTNLTTNEYTSATIKLKNEHITFLDTINPDNKSDAVRTVIEHMMNHTRRKKIEQTLLFVVLIIDLLVLLLIYFTI